VSWYATVGEIDLYRHSPTELVAPGDPTDGLLIVVGRSDDGGVTWASAPIVVE
jgi:hypothetical protein